MDTQLNGNWETVLPHLRQRMGDTRGNGSLVERIILQNAYAAQVQFFGVSNALNEVDTATRSLVRPRGGTVVRAFWWGFHVQISHEDLEAFLNSANATNDIIATISAAVPAPVGPWIGIVAGFIAGALSLLKGLDNGRGVYVSMSWFAPGVFVPTTV